MDVMDIRRQMMGVIAGMAGGSQFASGTFTPELDTGTVDINIGFVPKCVYVTVTDLTLISGKRQFITLSHIDNNGSYYEVANASNSRGTSIATCFSKIPSSTGFALSVNGNVASINANAIVSGCRFLSVATYQWFAYA